MTHTPTPAHQPGMTGGSMDEQLVHWIGERNNTLHGNGYGSRGMEHASGDEDEVTCTLCHSLLARLAREEEIAPEATDPTPGEVGLSDLVSRIREMATVEFDRKGYHDPRGAAIWDVAAFIAEEYAPALAARTADLRAERDKWRETASSARKWAVAELAKADARAEAAEAERQAEEDRANENATLVHEARAEVAELRAVVERVEALADEWEADYPTSLASCRREVDEWWIDLRAALTAHRHEEA